MSWIGLLAAALVGLTVGMVVAARLRTAPRPSAPSTPGEAALARIAIEWSDLGYVVIDVSGLVLYATDRAREMGVIRNGQPHPRIAEVASRAAVSGEPIDVDLGIMDAPGALSAPRRSPLAVHAVVRAIGDELILVTATDETEAMRLDSVRRDFVANVSHELKTPVAAISLLAEAVLDGADDAVHVRSFTERLVKESNRLASLVTELITLSRLQGADPLPDLAVVEMDGLISEATARTETMAERAGIRIVVDRPSGLLVLGDRPMLLTALTNLIDNAVHYSPPGTSVSISRNERDGQVEVAVTDRGIGIEPALQARVFERFFRVDPARSRQTGGTGLGLAIVKHVAANHGGSAVLWSRPGTGSTFTLKLPRYSPATPEPAGPPSRSVRFEQPAAAQSRYEQPGSAQIGTVRRSDPVAAGHLDAESADAIQSGANQNGADQNGVNHDGAKQNGMNQNGVNQNRVGQYGVDQYKGAR